jgi:putative transposase
MPSRAHRDWLLVRCEGGDFTLRGLVAERGLKVDYVSVWRFVHAEGLTHKKRPSRPARESART